MSQPGALGAPPFWRYDMISGGVIDSCPGQNGHDSRPSTVARSMRKSFGRFCRSVEMMTQRSVTGSRRSSDTNKLVKVKRKKGKESNALTVVKSVRIHRDDRLAGVEVNRHDVEPAWTIDPPRFRHIHLRQPHNRPPLPLRHRLRRVAEVAILAGLHF